MPETTTVIARLITAHSFYRGDFKVLSPVGAGKLLTNITFAEASIADRGNIPKDGTLFQISNYPIEGGDEQDINDSFGLKSRMKAYGTATSKDEIDEVKSHAPKAILQMLKEMAFAITDASQWQDYKPGSPPPSCKPAPKNLEEAVKRVRSAKGGSHKSIPKNGGQVRTTKNGTQVYDGLFVETSENGSFSITAGGQGMVVDKQGNIYNEGQVHNKNASSTRPLAIGGIPTMKNILDDLIPKQVVVPTIARLPDLSLLNLTFKLFNAFTVVKKLFSIKVSKDRWWESKVTVDERFEREFKEDQENQGLRGKIK